MATWLSLHSSSSLCCHSFSLDHNTQPQDLLVALERTATTESGVSNAELVLCSKQTGAELCRTPVEGPCNWEHLSAQFDPSTRQLQVSIQLLPAGSSDALLQAAATAAAGPAGAGAVGEQAAAAGREAQGAATAAKGTAAPTTTSGKPLTPKNVSGGQSLPTTTTSALPQAAAAEADTAAADSTVMVEVVGASGQQTAAAAAAGGQGKMAAGSKEAAAEGPITPQPTTDEAAEAPSDSAEAGSSQPGSQQAEAEAEASPAAAGEAAKKKKKKKKKKKAVTAGSAEDDGAEAGEGEEAEAEAPAGLSGAQEGAAAAAASAVAPAQEGEQAQQGAEAEGAASGAGAAAAHASAEPQAQGEAVQAEAEETAEEEAEAAAPTAPSIPGHTELGKEVPRSQFSGPFIREALSKDRKKDSGGGEDQWLIKGANAWSLEGAPGEASFSAFGVFDGHGGRQVATFASNSLLKAVMAEVDASSVPLQEVPEVEGLAEEEVAQWRLQATLMKRLPQACATAFRAVDADAQRRWPDRGGTTATLAVACGWELLVANVGDSCAYLDTGAEVLQVSGNHRLEDNKDEVARCQAAGHEIAPSSVDGKPAGPIRVWPGGLNMARTIGDAEAGAVVNADPEICQVTLPATGGRLIIGSDGLWDALHPKTAAHHCREMPAAEAAHRLLALAIKKDRLKDDVTVVVVDFLPNASARLPPGFALHRAHHGGGGGGGSEQPAHLAHVWHPMRESWDWLATDAERRKLALAEQRELEAQLAAEAERQRARQEEAVQVMLKKAARSGVTAETLHEFEGMSELHRELATLRLSPEDLQAGLLRAKEEHEEERRQEMEGEWETVGEDRPQPQDGGGQEAGPEAAYGGRAGGRHSARGGRGRGGREGRDGRGRGGRGRGRGYQPAEGAAAGADGPANGAEAQPAAADAPRAARATAGPQAEQQPAYDRRNHRGPGRGGAAGSGRGRGRAGGVPAPGATSAGAPQPPPAVPVGYVPPEASPSTASLYFRPIPVVRPAYQANGASQAGPAAPAAAGQAPGGRGRGGRYGGPGRGLSSDAGRGLSSDAGRGAGRNAGRGGGRGGAQGRGYQPAHNGGGEAPAAPVSKQHAGQAPSTDGGPAPAANGGPPAGQGRGRGGYSGRGRGGRGPPGGPPGGRPVQAEAATGPAGSA